MAINICFDTIEIWKHDDIGLAALCHEVAWYVDSNLRPQDNIDLDSARYEHRDKCHFVIFDRAK